MLAPTCQHVLTHFFQIITYCIESLTGIERAYIVRDFWPWRLFFRESNTCSIWTTTPQANQVTLASADDLYSNVASYIEWKWRLHRMLARTQAHVCAWGQPVVWMSRASHIWPTMYDRRIARFTPILSPIE